MMPDLGKYAVSVLSAYGASFALLALLVWLSLRRSRRAAAELRAIEARRRPSDTKAGVTPSPDRSSRETVDG